MPKKEVETPTPEDFECADGDEAEAQEDEVEEQPQPRRVTRQNLRAPAFGNQDDYIPPRRSTKKYRYRRGEGNPEDEANKVTLGF